jgi:hypothetical protein
MLQQAALLLGQQLTRRCWQHCGMKATWKFRAMRQDLTAFFVRRTDGTDELFGTDEEVLEFSVRARHYFHAKCLQRVEARSTGLIDFSVPNNKPRELARLRPHENGRDWRAEPSRLHHGAWHKTLEDAICYAAFRLRGHLSEIQILNRRNEVQGVVLIDQTGSEPSANGPAL